MSEWIFDQLPASGSVQGASPSAYGLGPVNLDMFVREVLQNARDQRISQLAQVDFSFYRFDGTEKKEFFESIGWEQLEQHLFGVAGSHGLWASQMYHVLESFYDAPLTVLRIDDSGTEGLSGGEDNQDNQGDNRGNFSSLCRDVLVTREDDRLRGGSHGLGKAVLWRSSSISTVFFSSKFENKFRLIGTTDLPGHKTEADHWAGRGWYGQPEETDRGKRAVSIWDNEAMTVAEGAYLARPNLTQGTTILIVGFREPHAEEERDLIEIASDVRKSASKWFWPSLEPGNETLRITVSVFDTGQSTYRKSSQISPDEKPFASALNTTTIVPRMENPGDVAEREDFTLKIPARTVLPLTEAIEGKVRLRVRRATAEEAPALRNKIAVMRGAGFVVKYRSLSRRTGDNQPFHAVLIAGNALGCSDANQAVERFLRSAEPPSHNDWIPNTDRIQAEYRRGAGVQLRRLWEWMDTAINQMAEEELPAGSHGPSRLAQMLPVRGRGGGAGGSPMFRVDKLEAYWKDGTWQFEGRIARQRNETRPWSFDVFLWLDAETGRGERLEISNFQTRTDRDLVIKSTKAGHCQVDSSVNRVRFEGQATVSDDVMTLGGIRKTRVRLQTRPKFL